METRDTVTIGARVSKDLHERLVAEQDRLEKLTKGIRPSINEVVQMLLEHGLEAISKDGKRSR